MADTHNFSTEHGSVFYKDSPMGVDAAAVALLRHAGASLIGKTVCSSFIIAAGKDR